MTTQKKRLRSWKKKTTHPCRRKTLFPWDQSICWTFDAEVWTVEAGHRRTGKKWVCDKHDKLTTRDNHNDGKKKNSHHSDISLRVLFDYGWEDAIPVGSTKVGGRTKGGNSILFSSDILDLKQNTGSWMQNIVVKERKTHNDVIHLIFLDLGRQVNVDLDLAHGILLFDSM